MRVTELDGPLLNFWVAMSEDLALPAEPDPWHPCENGGRWNPANYSPTNNWSVAGPIVSKYWGELNDRLNDWLGPSWSTLSIFQSSPLVWFMRAYVATKFGEEVEDQLAAPFQQLQNKSPTLCQRFKW